MRCYPDAGDSYKSTLDFIGFFCPGNCYEEIAELGCTNLAFCTVSPFNSGLSSNIDELADMGYKYFIIYMNDLCYGYDNTYAWNNMKTVIDKYGDRIIFYAEEPSVYFSGEQADVFTEQTRILREKFPNNKLLACEAYYVFQKIEYYSECLRYCTDIAYDLYTEMTEAEFQSTLINLYNLATYGQKLWLVPWGCTLNGGNERTLTDNFDMLYTYAKRCKRIVGMIPFAYIDAPAGGDWGNGLRSFFDKDNELYSEKLLNMYLTAGKEICGE